MLLTKLKIEEGVKLFKCDLKLGRCYRCVCGCVCLFVGVCV